MPLNERTASILGSKFCAQCKQVAARKREERLPPGMSVRALATLWNCIDCRSLPVVLNNVKAALELGALVLKNEPRVELVQFANV